MSGLVDRLKNWKTSVLGVGIGAAVVVIFKSFGCQLPSDWIAWAVGLAPTLLGLFSKD